MAASTPAPTPAPDHHRRYRRPPAWFLKTVDPKRTHPTVLAEARSRAASIQLRVADAITAFAGSMAFVYLHVVLFFVWMMFIEKSPWPTLTLIVSLEAIFLSTFVMIGQNRQAAFQQAKADRDYAEEETLLVENTELTRAIHALSKEIHEQVVAEVTKRMAAEQGVTTGTTAAEQASSPGTGVSEAGAAKASVTEASVAGAATPPPADAGTEASPKI